MVFLTGFTASPIFKAYVIGPRSTETEFSNQVFLKMCIGNCNSTTSPDCQSRLILTIALPFEVSTVVPFTFTVASLHQAGILK
ncbi:hypothetical protein D3C85_1302350 [compost metagenome]